MKGSDHDIAQHGKNTGRKDILAGQWPCQCGKIYLYRIVPGPGRTREVEWYEKNNDGSRGRELGICPDCRVPLVFFRKKVLEQARKDAGDAPIG
mgnify:CR=1 FL=1